MNSVTSTLSQMSEHELLDHFEALVLRDRSTTAQLLVAIAEIDERKLWARHACPSMFAFCVERFHMSEQVTAKRIWAARTARRFPVILAMVERGELHLSAIHLLARHLTADNYRDVLQRARHKSSREIERLVAALAPRPDVASRVRALPRVAVDAEQGVAAAATSGGATTHSESTSHFAPESRGSAAIRPCAGPSRVGQPLRRPAARPITALSPRRYKIEITIDEETHDKLRSLQDLLGRSQVGRDPAAIIGRAIDVLLVETLKRKAATTDRPQPACVATATTDRPESRLPACDATATTEVPQPRFDATATTYRRQPACEATATAHPSSPACNASPKNPPPRSRSIPASLRRAVWRRDCGRCRFVDGRGRRCNATSNVEFHHKSPFARGGRHDADNVELRCAAHNQYQADLDFGRDFMDARRSGARAPEHSPRNVA
jgi:5-methylcytosine-specific restriction endonuclease McrA